MELYDSLFTIGILFLILGVLVLFFGVLIGALQAKSKINKKRNTFKK